MMHPYIEFLKKVPKGKEILKSEITIPARSKDLFNSLISSILGQQLSTQVAKIMRLRFLALYKGKAPKISQVQATPLETLRGLGISGSKAQYIKNVADFFAEKKITHKKIEKLTDDEIIDLLTQIKGVGRWTVEMILIFSLGREDVFAVDDLTVRQEMIRLYKWQDLSKKDLVEKMKKKSLQWSPYRSFVCLHFWKWQGNKKEAESEKA
jgi:DNA-3-methyladenine glycosylase II